MVYAGDCMNEAFIELRIIKYFNPPRINCVWFLPEIFLSSSSRQLTIMMLLCLENFAKSFFVLEVIEVPVVGGGVFVSNDLRTFVVEIFYIILDNEWAEVGVIYLFFSAASVIVPYLDKNAIICYNILLSTSRQ